MQGWIIAALVLTNAFTANLAWEFHQSLNATQNALEAERALAAEKTTSDAERARFGAACVNWIKEEGVKEKRDEKGFYLGRSWRKHGQMVFEVVTPKDDIGKRQGDPLCTYDMQSGMMYSIYGANQAPWMFY